MLVTFDPFIHEYSDEKQRVILSVTQLLSKHHLAPDYSHVSHSVLTQSAEKGTNVHLAFETAIKTNGADDSGNTLVRKFLDEIYPLYTNWQSEVMVWYEGALPYAGTVDLICYDPKTGRWIIWDIKTTSTVHRESVSWQTTLYRKAWCQRNDIIMLDTVDLKCLHAREDLKVIDLDAISDEDVEELLSYEADGLPYDRTTALMIKPDTEALALEYESRMIELKRASEELKDVYDKLKDALYEQMLDRNITNLETPKLKISLTRPYTKSGFDSKGFQKDHPELYNAYKTESQVKGNVKISLKEGA